MGLATSVSAARAPPSVVVEQVVTNMIEHSDSIPLGIPYHTERTSKRRYAVATLPQLQPLLSLLFFSSSLFFPDAQHLPSSVSSYGKQKCRSLLLPPLLLLFFSSPSLLLPYATHTLSSVSSCRKQRCHNLFSRFSFFSLFLFFFFSFSSSPLLPFSSPMPHTSSL
ncbi:hypothetical protein C4D60_Mb00t00880 [Musa balbisiana]|uniref:Uncharacterized protein n=1 Tax=Musa balbisiana TaxID=52838 RepID=A0A4S8I934_MUSBA|nr:hypothetical protein C4D60_Mb00t00880 [Musa balbisiana]